MSILGTWSHDHYTDIAMEYHPDSNAVVSAGAGRNSTAAITTIAGTTYWLLNRVKEDQSFSLLTLWYGISINVGGLPAFGTRGTLLQFSGADGAQIAITVDWQGIIEVYRGTQAGTLLASAVNPITINTTYYLETGLFIDNVAGTAELRLWSNSTDVETIIDFTGDTLAAGTGEITTIGNVESIPPVDAVPLTCNYDDGYLADDMGSVTGFQGNKHMEAHLVDGAGFYTNWEPFPTLPNYGNVDENPPDGDTSYNFAPLVDPSSSPSFVSASSSTNSPSVPTPAGITEGDLIVILIRTLGTEESSNIIPGFTAFVPPGTGLFLSEEGGGIGGLFLFDPFSTLAPADSTLMWCVSVATKLAGASEPATYGPFLDLNGDPLENVEEIAVLCYTGVNLSIPVEGSSASVAGASPTGDPPSNTIVFAQVNALTDNDLIIAMEFPESQVPATPAGYSGDYTSSHFNVSSKLKATAGGEIPPSTAIGAVETWGTCCISVKARAQIETGGMDTFTTEDTTAADVTVANVKLCTRVDEAGHTVGAVMRQDSTDDLSSGIAPETTYRVSQFIYETAPDSGAWDPTKYNDSESGYALDSEPSPPGPDEAVIFWVDAGQMSGDFGDGDPINSFVELGIHGYTMSLAGAVTGDYVAQTFQTSVAAINNQDSIEGLTESLTCTPSTRSIGYLNLSSDSDLFLGDAFTLIAVFNVNQFEGCWQNGANIVIVGRKGNNITNFCGWQLQLDGGPDPAGQGELSFIRRNAIGTVLVNLLSGFPSINEGQTYIGTVICDGTTVRLRLDGVEVDSAVNSTSIEPLANNQLNFLQQGDGFGQGDALGPPQGQVPYVKIWNVELSNTDLLAEEAALAALYQ